MQHRQRVYTEDGFAALPRTAVQSGAHPLNRMGGFASSDNLGAPGTPLASGKGGSVVDDPLTPNLSLPPAFHDPLGAMGGTPTGPLTPTSMADPLTSPSSARPPKVTQGEEHEDSLSEWDSKKAYILQKFAATGSLKVTPNMDILSAGIKRKEKTTAAQRIEELENPLGNAREEHQNISMQESITRLRELNQEISYAWLNHERVAALKTSIKVARLLCDTSVPQFYPTLFVIVTEVMDTVGKLVYDRIRQKAEKEDDGTHVMVLPFNFSAQQVRQDAKDTCTNWFYKIGAIPDLLPRIYLEMAIVRCMYFLQDDPPMATFTRLAEMMRGLADPLAAVYARCYLVRRGAALVPMEKKYLLATFADFMQLHARLHAGEYDERIAAAGLSRPQYLNLLEPGIEWILSRICFHASQKQLQSVSRLVASADLSGNGNPPPELIRALVSSLPAEFVAQGALAMATMIKSSGAQILAAQKEARRGAVDARGRFLDTSGAAGLSLSDVAACFRTLGEKLCVASPPVEMQLQLVNEVWKVVAKWRDLEDYLKVADIFVEYTLKHLGRDEIDLLLRDISHKVSHMERVEEAQLWYLESLIFRIMEHYNDLAEVMALEHFIPIIDAFHGAARQSVAKRLLLIVAAAPNEISDPVLMHFVFEQARVAHDAVDSMSTESDRKNITSLLTKFVLKVDFGRDFEQHLNFLVDCRHAFSRMEVVQEMLVHSANSLCIRTLQMTRGKLNRRIVAFVKACVAYNQITIPSILDTMKQIRLYLASAEVALQHGLSQQAEALVRSSLATLAEALSGGETGRKVLMKLGPENEAGFLDWVGSLCGFLVVMPGSPEPKKGPFYLIKGLLKVLEDFPWAEGSDGQVRSYIGLVLLMAALVQEKLAYHIPGVESNDVLYAGDPGYQEELIELTHSLVKQVVAMLSAEVASSNSTAVWLRGLRLLDMSSAVMIGCECTPEMASLVRGLVAHAGRLLPDGDGYLKRTKLVSERWENSTKGDRRH